MHTLKVTQLENTSKEFKPRVECCQSHHIRLCERAVDQPLATQRPRSGWGKGDSEPISK